MCQTVVVDDLAQGRQRLGEHRRVLDARRPYRRVEVHRLVGVEHRGQPGAHGGMRERGDPLDHESLRGQPHPDQVPLGHAHRPQRARHQEQRPERVDHLGRDAPLLEQLIVEPGQHDLRRRPVGEPPKLLVLAQRGDRVQVRGHSEHVVGRLVCAEPVREHPPG